MSLLTLYQHYTSGGISAGLSDATQTFTLNKMEVTLYSGAIHYFRVPRPYWRDRLRKMRAAGINTVETYVPWNLHEPEPGSYDFGEGGTDFQDFLHLEEFLKIAQEEDLLAIVRPGPYICSEWEFGGLPSWLLREKNMRVRTSDEKFMAHVTRYFKVLLTLLSALQFTKGGPIIAFQIENEYGSLDRRDMAYLKGLRQIFLDNGIVELLVTADGATIGNHGQIPGVLYTANLGDDAKTELDVMQTFQPGKPSMVMEYWSGWFYHWTENRQSKPASKFLDVTESILKYPASVNFYMFHGGTSFGFMNGANIADESSDNKGYQPDINSYDYDAPLSEIGDYTEKYHTVQHLISKYNKVPTYTPPKPMPALRKAYCSIIMNLRISMNSLIRQAPYEIASENIIPMEHLPINNNSGQSYGYIVYRQQYINIPADSVLTIKGRVCDTAMVLINGELKSHVLKKQQDLKGFGYWMAKDASLNLGGESYKAATLDIVVENWGRNNFGSLAQFTQHKGLWQGNVMLNDNILKNWKIIPLEFKKKWTQKLSGWTHINAGGIGPALYKGHMHITGAPVDTFVDMRKWKKGIIIFNGFVLSRHLHLGPQQTAYLPAPLLKEGDNEILVFEHFKSPNVISFSNKVIFETH